MNLSDTAKEIKHIYVVAIPLLFSLFLGNILEVVDLTIASFIDIEILKAISLLERYRFVYGAILIGFTSTLSMYMNRLLPEENFSRLAKIHYQISNITKILGVFFALTFFIGIYSFTEINSPLFIYGVGTAVNILIMFLSTPLYITLVTTKKTKVIFKVGVIATFLNIIFTWLLAKELELGTIGVIFPTIISSLLSYLFLLKEVQHISFLSLDISKEPSEHKNIFKYVKLNISSNFFISMSELLIITVALNLGDIGVLYGIFFAFEKLFNAITNAVGNSSAITFSEKIKLHKKNTPLKNALILSLINLLSVTLFSFISLQVFNKFLALKTFLPLIITIVALNSLDYFFRKTILRPAGDISWTHKVNLSLITCGNFLIAGLVYIYQDSNVAAQLLFTLILFQSLISFLLVFYRVLSRKWYHEV